MMLFCILSLQARESYRGHQVIRARVETAAQAELPAGSGELELLDLWSEVVLQKVASELHPKVRNHREGPY